MPNDESWRGPWVAEVYPDGKVDVSCDRRPVRYDCDDLHEARHVMRQYGAETFTLVEPDGYRTPNQRVS
jgi:hypothetical protein